MEFNGDSLDSILHQLYPALLRDGVPHEGGSRGPTRELLGVALRMHRPRARISRSENRGKPFSALGELLWYLSGVDSLEFIRPYVPLYARDAVDGVLEGAYGPRLMRMRDGIDQFASIERLLTAKPGSRRAVIQLFNAEDITTDRREIPCTTTLQFHLRGGLLHLSVTLRSNDAYFGLPHDVFCFTMLQEMMARRLKADLGEYYQYVGSMHVYEAQVDEMAAYGQEGWQQTIEMPPMPEGNPFELVEDLIAIERRLRSGEELRAADVMADEYWADVVRLLQVFWARETAGGRFGERVAALRSELASRTYEPYVDGRTYLGSRMPAGPSADDQQQDRKDVAEEKR